MRTLFFLCGWLAVSAAWAQTTAPAPAGNATGASLSAHPTSPSAKSATGKKAAATKVSAPKSSNSKGTSKKQVAKKTPVIAPRHGPVPRRPVHGAAAAAAPKADIKLATKPAAKLAAKPGVPAIPADEGTVTHLHLPRFLSLKTDDVNMRSGPGKRYPVIWTYKRRELPVKVEREFDVWRAIEDMDGVKGWVHQATLTSKRTFVITGTDTRTVRAEADSNSAAVAILKPGVVGRILSCEAAAAWCQVQVGGYRGWLERSAFWGSDPGEAVAP